MAAVLLLAACDMQLPEKSAAVPQSAELSEETAQTATEQLILAPEALTAMLDASGSNLQALSKCSCKQLITVQTTGAAAKIDLYVLSDGQWLLQEDLSCEGFVGQNGAVKEKQEGDKSTPKGLFPVTQAFYINDVPQTGLPLFEITEDTYWIDDPSSVYYNTRVEGVENKDWNSAEHMRSYSASYEYGFVIGYNLASVPGAGSAIFFHVGSRPTAGCVATDRAFVLQYLAILDSAQSPYILIN